MNRDYVQQYVKLEREHWWFVVRQKILLQFLHKYCRSKNLRILNIGAAGGASSQWLSVLGNVVSLESDSFFFEYLSSKNFDAVHASVTAMPFTDNEFDLVCAFDVIEHVENDLQAVKEIQRVCKTGGFVFITVPAFKMLWSNHDLVNGHYRRYKKKSLQELISKPGTLQMKEVTYFNTLLFIPVFFARKAANLFSGDSENNKSDFEFYKTGKLMNKLLSLIFTIELTLLKFIRLPFGISLLGIWKKS